MVFHTETSSNKHFVEISDYLKILRGVEIGLQPHFLNQHSQVAQKSKISFSQRCNLIKLGFFSHSKFEIISNNQFPIQTQCINGELLNSESIYHCQVRQKWLKQGLFKSEKPIYFMNPTEINFKHGFPY